MAALSIVGTVLSCSLAAYAFSRLRFPGRGPLFTCALATLMVPPQVTLIPSYILFSRLGWLNTLLPLVVPLARPALGVVVVLTFAHSWNAFTQPLVYLNDLDEFTVAIGLRTFISVRFVNDQAIMAMSFLATLPMLLTFLVAQRAFMRGIQLGPTTAAAVVDSAPRRP